MKRYLLPILTVFVLAISLIGCSFDEQAGRHQEEPASEFDKRVVFQKVDNLQVENFLRQQELNDKISIEQSLPGFFYSAWSVSEWRKELGFLRQQYRQLQELKYEPTPERLERLLTGSLAEQQHLKTEIDRINLNLSKAEQALARGESVIEGGLDIKANLSHWKGEVSDLSEQLEFLTRQYQELKELRDFLLG